MCQEASGRALTPAIGSGKGTVDLGDWEQADATINPGPFHTGFNDTGVEAMDDWWRPETALLDRPDFSSYLDNQYDPQEMIDTMVRVIPPTTILIGQFVLRWASVRAKSSRRRSGPRA